MAQLPLDTTANIISVYAKTDQYGLGDGLRRAKSPAGA